MSQPQAPGSPAMEDDDFADFQTFDAPPQSKSKDSCFPVQYVYMTKDGAGRLPNLQLL